MENLRIEKIVEKQKPFLPLFYRYGIAPEKIKLNENQVMKFISGKTNGFERLGHVESKIIYQPTFLNE